jgi:hypothetical protein
MNYIKELADKIYDQIPPEVLPEAENIDELMLIYAVLASAKGKSITNEDVHNAWAAWMSFTNPDHRSITSYDSLAPDVQAQDTPFTEAIQRVIG